MEKELYNKQNNSFKYQFNKNNEEKIFCIKKPKNLSSHIYLMKKSKTFYNNINNNSNKNNILNNQKNLNNTNNNNLTINNNIPLTSRENKNKIFFEKIIKLNNHKKSYSSIISPTNFSCINLNNNNNIIYKKKIINNPLTLSKQKSCSNFSYNIDSNLKNNFKKNIKFENNSIDSTAQTDNLLLTSLYNTYNSTIDRDIITPSNKNTSNNIINYNNINLYSLNNNNSKNKINICFNYIRNKEKRKIASNYQKKDINYILNKENINNYNYLYENKNYNNIFLNKTNRILKTNKNKYELSFNYFNKKKFI